MGQPQKPIATEQLILSLERVLQNLREEDDVNTLIEITIGYLKEQFNYQLIWLALYDRLNHVLLGKGGITPDSNTSALEKKIILTSGDLLEQLIIVQRPLGVVNLQKEPRAAQWQEIATKYEIQGTIILPIRYRDYCLGVALLGSQRWGYLLSAETKSRLQMVLGQLGASLYQKEKEIDLQQKQAKRPDQPLLKLVDNLLTLNNLDQRLEAVVKSSHEFISPSRTNIYWFERQGHYFWCRMSNQLVNMNRNPNPQRVAAGMTVQELKDFYYALLVNEIVCIGESRSSLKSNFTGKLLERLKVRSLLAAPIIWQKDLLGFLAVESEDSRIWTTVEKSFIQGAAGLVSLVAPTDNMENVIKTVQQDSQLMNQVTKAVYSEQDLQETLQICAKKVLERIPATRFIMLQFESEHNNYQAIHQSLSQNRRAWTTNLNVLSDVDKRYLQQSNQVIEIQNFEEDLRFSSWRSSLQENNVRALLLCNCVQGRTPELLLLITHEMPRSWTTLEKELLWIVSQQIGVIVRHLQLRNTSKQQQKIFQIFIQLLRILGQLHSSSSKDEVKKLECAALEQIASILDCPLAVLLSWFPGDELAEIIPGVITNSYFGVVGNIPISIEGETLIQWALTEQNYLNLQTDNLPLETRKWLSIPDNTKVLVMALRTRTDYQPTAILLLVDYQNNPWSELSINTTVTLVTQLAWWRRQHQITQLLESRTDELQQLNWYKNRRLEEIQRMTTLLLKQIQNVGIPTNELTQTRYRLLLRQLDQTTTSMTQVVKLEQWHLYLTWEIMPIASILKRALERLENILTQRHLWVGVHGLDQSMEERDASKGNLFIRGTSSSGNQSAIAIAGDIVKIELVIHELLMIACQRSQDGSRIDLWCRPIDERFLELSITDNGAIEPKLLAGLDQHASKDLLISSNIYQPEALHLMICQKMMKHLGGELHIYQLPDKRVVSRLVLPLAQPSNTGIG